MGSIGWRLDVEEHWLGLVLDFASRLQCGELTVQLPGGCRRTFTGELAGPKATLQLNRSRAIRRSLTGGALGFAEAYLDEDWDSPDLPRLMELLARNEVTYENHYRGRAWFRWPARMQHVLRWNSKRGSRRNILAHYDLGNSFYETWLDPSMTYSCARFEPEHLSLEAAQNAKYASLAEKIALQPDQHMLEIGCGWGGFTEFAAREIGSNVTAITISEQQHAFAAERIQAAGLNDRVEIKLQDYRDVDACYDRIVSIEMFEAVGERNWPVYFDKLVSSLKPGGVAGLQVITIADRYFESYRKGVDFIQRHVFPGGMLPSPQSLRREMDKAGLQKLGELTFGRDYAMTLAVWYERFQKAWPTIAALGFDQRFKRLWQYYLAYCEAGFRVGATNVHQIAVKPA